MDKEKFEEKDIDEAATAISKLAMAKLEKEMSKKADKKVKKESIGLTKDTVKAMSGKQRTEEFIKALIQNDKMKLKVLSTGVNALGGFLVPLLPDWGTLNSL